MTKALTRTPEIHAAERYLSGHWEDFWEFLRGLLSTDEGVKAFRYTEWLLELTEEYHGDIRHLIDHFWEIVEEQSGRDGALAVARFKADFETVLLRWYAARHRH